MGRPVSGGVFEEMSVAPRVVSVARSHLSIELGHLYLDDFEAGPDRLTQMLRQVVPWAHSATQVVAAAVAPQKPRVSTCFLVDDYFAPVRSPGQVAPMLLEAAASAGLTIDYLVRESACAQTEEVALAELVLGRLVADPPRGANGSSRPTAQESGWLCNGVRSPQRELEQAMRRDITWRPPIQNRAHRHSVFVDVELWSDQSGSRQWSCAFLAAVWQLLRLGLLRIMGDPVVSATPWTEPFPETWTDLPAVTQLNPRAAPFAAFRTFSVLAGRFLSVEHAVRTIISQFAVEQAVAEDVAARAHREGLALPGQVVDRIEYAFPGLPWSSAG